MPCRDFAPSEPDPAEKHLRSWATLRSIFNDRRRGAQLEICLIRHGETTLNAVGLVSGQADTPLTWRGRLAAVEAGRELSGEAFDLGITSPLRRSRETLAILRAAAGWDEMPTCSDWRIGERSLGDLEYRPNFPIPELERGDLHWRPRHGEDYLSVSHRLLDLFAELIEIANDKPLRVLLCAHVGPMRIASGILNNDSDSAAVLSYHFPNLSPLCLGREDLRVPAFLEDAPQVV
jgi:broad specificity phosphatase PhoE